MTVKVRGSSSAFQLGNLVLTRYNSGCHRFALAKAQGFYEDIGGDHAERGQFNEDQYEERLKMGGLEYFREEPVSEPIYGIDDAVFAGRLDFRVVVGLDSRIDELKSTESPHVLLEVIKRGKYKLENLAQLISYMITKTCVNGQLIYTHYKRDPKTRIYKLTAERTFEVMIDDEGSILVDKKPSGFNVKDQLFHRLTAAECVKNNVVWSRPFNAASKFDGPCARCPFSMVCDAYDRGEITSTQQFIEHCLKGNK